MNLTMVEGSYVPNKDKGVAANELFLNEREFFGNVSLSRYLPQIDICVRYFDDNEKNDPSEDR